jgi:hypothetical protein
MMTQDEAGDFEVIAFPELNGGAGPARVTLLGTPVLRSTRDGRLKPPEMIKVDDGEGGWDLVDPVLFYSVALMFGCGSYVMKLKEYLPRLIFQCKGCRAVLPEEPSEPHRFEIDATSLELPPSRVRLHAPAVACPRCGRRHVLWSDEMAAAIEGALAEALASLPTASA